MGLKGTFTPSANGQGEPPPKIDFSKLKFGKTGHAPAWDSETTATYEGKNNGTINMIAVADGIATRHFRDAARDQIKDINFEMGGAKLDGSDFTGIRVSASPSETVDGKGQGYTGWVARVENDRVVEQGPFSAKATMKPGFEP